MTFTKRISTLSLDELVKLTNIVEEETNRRQVFIDRLKTQQLKELPLTINSRDLLYRIVAAKMGVTTSKVVGDLTIKNLFLLLKKDDWQRMQYINAKSYLEIQDTLIQHEAPLDKYYGLIDDTPAKKSSTKEEKAY